MTLRQVLKVILTVKSPFLFPSLAAARFGLDREAMRDRKDCPLIPADQIRGVLRHACQQLFDQFGKSNNPWPHDLIKLVFGQGSDEAGFALEPARGRIFFGDLSSSRKDTRRIAHRVMIDDETGAAKEGHLLSVELVEPMGRDVTFSGTAILLGTKEVASDIVKLLNAAAGRISAIGAMKSAGFGEVVQFEVKNDPALTTDLARSATRGPLGARVRVGFCIDRPFLIDPERPAETVYVGRAIIPGGALKAALARKLEIAGRAKEFRDDLTALSISHSVPDGWAARTLPLSVVANDFGVSDALGQSCAVIEGQPALFRSDWKPKHKAMARRAASVAEDPSLRREDRGHNRIDPLTGTVDKGALYFAQSVDPEDRMWSCILDYSAVAEKRRAALHGALWDGIDGLGMTGASLSFQTEEKASPPSAQPRSDGSVDVTIETAAVMAGPTDGEDAFTAYQAYWQRVLGPETQLVDFLAQQELVSGYHANRFKVGTTYRAVVLTLPGSIFRLRSHDPARLDACLRAGLPPPVLNGIKTTWKTCTFQPENGYGRIIADWQGIEGSQP